MLYRSKPQDVEAIQWLDHNIDEILAFAPDKARIAGDLPHMHLELLAGKDGAQEWVPVPAGHWLVHLPGDLSDVWPVDDDYFTGKYEAVDG